jgi:hypothetical protein
VAARMCTMHWEWQELCERYYGYGMVGVGGCDLKEATLRYSCR